MSYTETNLHQSPYTGGTDDHDDDASPNKPALTIPERNELREAALARFFPGIDFVSGSEEGGLKLAHDGALAVAICTGRKAIPKFHFGPQIAHFPKIAQAELAYLVLCGVVYDETTLVEQKPVFFAVPLQVKGDNAFVMGYPLAHPSQNRHHNVNLLKRNDEWILSLGNKVVLPMAGYDLPIGTVFVPAHLRTAPGDLAAQAKSTTLTGLKDCQEYAALVSASDPNVEIVCMLRRKG